MRCLRPFSVRALRRFASYIRLTFSWLSCVLVYYLYFVVTRKQGFLASSSSCWVMPYRPQYQQRHGKLDYRATPVGGAPLRVRAQGRGATNYRNAQVVGGAYYRLPDSPLHGAPWFIHLPADVLYTAERIPLHCWWHSRTAFCLLWYNAFNLVYTINTTSLLLEFTQCSHYIYNTFNLVHTINTTHPFLLLVLTQYLCAL